MGIAQKYFDKKFEAIERAQREAQKKKKLPLAKPSHAQPTPTSHVVTGSAPKILTVTEVADLLQIPKSSVYEKTRVRRGAAPPLPCRRVGKYLRFFDTEVMEWLVGLPQNKLVRRTRKKIAA
jgi:excisionase family DNA binding protein